MRSLTLRRLQLFAWANVVLHALGLAVAWFGLRPGSVVAPLAERMAYLAADPLAWRWGWGLFMLCTLVLVGYMAVLERLLPPRSIAGRLALVLTASGMAVDLLCDVLQISVLLSAAAQLGRTFSAPQGLLTGLRGREVVDLPPPFGPRAVLDFESPELDLFPALLGARTVRVKVGFESRLATASMAVLSYLGPRLGTAIIRTIAPAAPLLSHSGHSGGVVKVELWSPDGAHAAASLGGPHDGQRMAALPAAFVAQALWEKTDPIAGGVLTAWEALGARTLVARLTDAGYELEVGAAIPPPHTGTVHPPRRPSSPPAS